MREKQPFAPIQDGRVNMYVCGPTVYDVSHLGHAKTYVSFDVVSRWLRYSGFKVRYVQNITDVGHMLDDGEDRILKGARREKVEPMEIVERYTSCISMRWMRSACNARISRRAPARTSRNRSRW